MLLSKPFIIADIGSTWNRTNSEVDNLQLALRSIEAVATAGANAVKFQAYTHQELYGYEQEDRYALPLKWLEFLRARAQSVGLEFMCTPFSVEAAQIVNDYVRIHKVASSDMKNIQLLETLANYGKPTIVSTAASHFLEIQWLINLWKDMTHAPLCILDCVGAYPAKPEDYHLNLLGQLYGNIDATGVSDHTLSSVVALASIGFGGTVFEKHFDAFKTHGFDKVPDSCVAIGPVEMEKYVSDIKTAFLATETLSRRPRRSEDDFQTMHRRRIIAIKDLKTGDKLQLDVNYGAFRTKTPDFRGAPMENALAMDGKIMGCDIKAFHGIASSDIVKE